MDVSMSLHRWIPFSYSFGQPHGGVDGLLCVEQVPDVLQEPYIFTGYRPLGKPWKYYLFSMMHLHNESINVWSHTLGFFLVLLRLIAFLGDFDLLEDKVAWPAMGFGACCLMSLMMSSAAHLFHSKSRWQHFIFFLLDYMGVTFYSFGTGIISMYTCSSRRYHDALLTWFLPANVLLSWFSFYACCMAKTHLCHDNIKRKLLMLAAVTLQGIFIALPVITRYVECFLSPSCSLHSLNHISLVFLIFCLCAASFAGNLPESWRPGTFDIFGHGHQIFHILAVVAMLLEVRIIDIEVNVTGTAHSLKPELAKIFVAFAALLVLEVATFIYYIHFIYFHRLSHEIPRQDVQDSLLAKEETESPASADIPESGSGAKKHN